MLRHLLIYSTLFGLALPLQNCKQAVTHTLRPKGFENRLAHRDGRQAYKFYQEKHWANAVTSYLKAAKEAANAGDSEYATKLLINAGANQLLTFRYQDALTTMERARKVAEQSGNRDFAAVVNANIVSLYLQMGNLAGASAAAQRAMAELRESNPQYTQVILPVAQLRAELQDMAGAETLIAKVIDGAYRVRDMESAAWAWDYLGYRYELNNRIPEADAAATESLRLREIFKLTELCSSYFHLAKIRVDQGDLHSAAALLDAAVGELKSPGNVTPAWYIYLERGRLFQKAGNRQAAWENLGKAVNLARNWRAEVVANDANRTSAEVALSELYSLYIDVGNEYAAETGTNLARDTFQAAEENRAASLRALAEREIGWHTQLPPSYWTTLDQLQSAEREALRNDSPQSRAAVLHIRTILDEMEAASGAPHTFVVRPAVEATQSKLDPQSVFFSFQLGERASWLWAVTKGEVHVFSLPPRQVLASQISEFRECVRRAAPEADTRGAALYSLLFAQVPERLKRPERWIFSLDQEMFSLPLPALVMRYTNGEPEYLGVSRALEGTPGALIYAAAPPPKVLSGPLLAVGDGIYNRADSRLQSSVFLHAGFVPSMTEPANNDAFRFARLWGAGEELISVKEAWGAPNSVALSGAQISREEIWRQLAKQPAVIHFATHVLEANDQLHTGWIALSLAPNGNSEFLSPSDISAHKITAGLVVLNGCSSGNGEIRAASGLMGLTRAWIAAGATEVVATRWPGPDDSGIFFGEFYRNLKTNPEMGSAFALRAAFRGSIRQGGWRARPQFWASYFLTGIN